jgi:hypothetical protein
VHHLLGKGGALAGRRVRVEGETVIGRGPGDLVTEDPEVSRRHAVVRSTDEGLQIEDLGSTNGTFVNDKRIEAPTKLAPGDVIRVGKTTFEVEADLSSADTIVADPPAPMETETTSRLEAPSASAAGARPPPPAGAGEDDASTGALPGRKREPRAREERSGMIFVVVALVLLVVLAVVVFRQLWGDPSDRFASSADEICQEEVERVRAMELGRATRRNAARIANTRGRALAEIRELDRPEDGTAIGDFFNAFEKTNRSIKRLEKATEQGERAAQKATVAVRRDVRAEKRAARGIGLELCGGMGIR